MSEFVQPLRPIPLMRDDLGVATYYYDSLGVRRNVAAFATGAGVPSASGQVLESTGDGTAAWQTLPSALLPVNSGVFCVQTAMQSTSVWTAGAATLPVDATGDPADTVNMFSFGFLNHPDFDAYRKTRNTSYYAGAPLTFSSNTDGVDPLIGTAESVSKWSNPSENGTTYLVNLSAWLVPHTPASVFTVQAGLTDGSETLQQTIARNSADSGHIVSCSFSCTLQPGHAVWLGANGESVSGGGFALTFLPVYRA